MGYASVNKKLVSFANQPDPFICGPIRTVPAQIPTPMCGHQWLPTKWGKALVTKNMRKGIIFWENISWVGLCRLEPLNLTRVILCGLTSSQLWQTKDRQKPKPRIIATFKTSFILTKKKHLSSKVWKLKHNNHTKLKLSWLVLGCLAPFFHQNQEWKLKLLQVPLYNKSNTRETFTQMGEPSLICSIKVLKFHCTQSCYVTHQTRVSMLRSSEFRR